MTDCSLYLISPPKITLKTFLPELAAALAFPVVRSFQLRLKDASDEEVLEASREIQPMCAGRGAAFILNDRPDLAVRAQADGVHLGQEDMKVEEARAIVGEEMVIGVSCHASRDMGIDAAEQGADYVAFGAFYPTTSKPKEKVEKWGVPEPEILEWWSTYTVIPCVAIGGITQANCMPLVKAGADFIATITSVWNHPKGAGAAVEEFSRVLKV